MLCVSLRNSQISAHPPKANVWAGTDFAHPVPPCKHLRVLFSELSLLPVYTLLAFWQERQQLAFTQEAMEVSAVIKKYTIQVSPASSQTEAVSVRGLCSFFRDHQIPFFFNAKKKNPYKAEQELC